MRLVRYTYPTRNFINTRRAFAGSPWGGLESEIDRLFASALNDYAPSASGRFPVDLYEDQANAYVRAELPGVSRDAIQVETVDGYLTITVNAKTGEGEAATTPAYTRSVSLPEAVQADQVTAAYENGVLTVTLPKRVEAQPKKVTVAIK